MHEEDFDLAHMNKEPTAPRSGRSDDYEVDGGSEGDARESREGREGREAVAEVAVQGHDFIAFTSEAERRRRLEMQFHAAAGAPPLQFGQGHHRPEAAGGHGSTGCHGSSSPASSSSTTPPSGAALKRGNTIGSSSLLTGPTAPHAAHAASAMRPSLLRSNSVAVHPAPSSGGAGAGSGSGAEELARDARQMAARLHKTHAAAPALDGAATQVQLQQTLRQGVELLAMSMAARLEQVESKAEREMASMRREVQSQSELLRTISARLGAPTAARLATNQTWQAGGDASGSPAGRGRRPSVAPACQCADPGSHAG